MRLSTSVTVVLVAARFAAAQDITFAKHVAPIIQQKCQTCHRPNSIAPMSLLTYDDVSEYADEIRARV